MKIVAEVAGKDMGRNFYLVLLPKDNYEIRSAREWDRTGPTPKWEGEGLKLGQDFMFSLGMLEELCRTVRIMVERGKDDGEPS